MCYRRPCNLPLRWRLPRREKGERGKGVQRPQAGNVKLWTIICWAKYNGCQMNWSSTSRSQQYPPPHPHLQHTHNHENATGGKSVCGVRLWGRASAQNYVTVSIFLSLPVSQAQDQVPSKPVVNYVCVCMDFLITSGCSFILDNKWGPGEIKWTQQL